MIFEVSNIEDECNANAEWHHERMDRLDIRGRLCRIVYALDLGVEYNTGPHGIWPYNATSYDSIWYRETAADLGVMSNG